MIFFKRKVSVISASLTIFLLSIGTSSLGQSNASTAIPMDPDVKIGKLANGFTYYIKPNKVPDNKVFMQLVVKAGIMHEDPDQLGLAHLLEHMAFKGTKHFPGEEMVQLFNENGLKPGGDWNASTAFSNTIYWLNIPADNEELFDAGFLILRDWAQDMSLEPKAIDQERGVVLGEGRNGPRSDLLMDSEIASRLLNNSKFPSNRRHLHDENIKKFRYESLIRFYRDWYRPDLEAIIIVGDIDVKQVEDKIKALFSDLELPVNPKNALGHLDEYRINLNGTNKFVMLTHPEMREIRVRIYQKRPGKFNNAVKTKKDMKRTIMDDLYNEMIHSRFMSQLLSYSTRYQGLSNRISRGSLSEFIDALETRFSIDNYQHMEFTFKSVIGELQRIAQNGFNIEELSKAKKLILNDIRKTENLDSRYIAQELTENFVWEAAVPSAETKRALVENLMNEIRLAEINSIARDWIRSSTNRDIVIIAPDSEKNQLPDESTINRWWREISSSKLEPVQTLSLSDPILRDSELPKNSSFVVDRAEIEELGIIEVKLSNGIRLILKPLKSAEKLYLAAHGPGPLMHHENEDYYSVYFAPFIINHAGVGRYNKFELDEILSAKNVSVRLGWEASFATIAGSCDTKEIETLFQLIYQRFVSPKRDKMAFEHWLATYKNSIVTSGAQYEFRNLINEELYSHNLTDEKFPSLEDLDQVDFERAWEVYEKYFSNPGNFTFILVGDLEEDNVIRLFLKYFGTFASDHDMASRIKGSSKGMFKGINKVMHLGSDGYAEAELFFQGRYKPSLENDILMELVESAFRIKIRERLRQKEGDVYSVNTSLWPNTVGSGLYSLRLNFKSATSDVHHLISCTIDEYKKLLDNGLSEDLFRSAKAQLQSSINENLTRDIFWYYYLKEKTIANVDLDEILKKEAIANLITLGEINEFVTTRLTAISFSRFVLLPDAN